MSLVEAFLREKAAKTEAALERCFDTLTGAPPSLLEAMRYSLFAGGTRLRPALAVGAAEMISVDDTAALPAACALEMIHTYSLMHDDLPAMDNDDFRRGRPTAHKVFGEAAAILAGDALLTLAFELAAAPGDVRVVREMACAAGALGMAGGQQLDIEAEGHSIGLDELRHIHALKTGALIRVSLRTGALLAGVADNDLVALSAYGEALGLAFQIADDILNVTSTEAALGKPVGSDADREKSTYPAIMGLEGARALADEAAAAAVAALDHFGAEADIFRALARYVVERDK